MNDDDGAQRAASVGRSAARGVAWLAAGSVSSRALGLVATLVLTHHLAPEDYGSVSVAAVLATTAGQLSSLGIGQYVIAHPSSGRAAGFHTAVYTLLAAVILLAATTGLREPLGGLFDAPDMGRFLPGLALSVMMDRIGHVPERILVRDMRFRVSALARTAGEVAFPVVAVATVREHGAQAIVLANLARSAMRTVILIGATGWREWLEPCRLSLAETRAMFRFGLPLYLASFAGFATRRWDNLLVSRFFGSGTMGMYNLAYNLADLPAAHIGEHIGDVLLPSFSHLGAEDRRRALMRAVAVLSLLMSPLAVGTAAIAPTVVRTVLDPRWHGVAPMLAILSATAIARPIAWAVSSYLAACNQPRSVLGLELGRLAAVLALLATVGRQGPRWACAAVGLGFALNALGSLWLVHREARIPLGALAEALLVPLIPCLPMVAAIAGVRHGLPLVALPPAAALAVEIAVGAAVYAGSALLLLPGTSREILRLAREVLTSRRASAAPPTPPDRARA